MKYGLYRVPNERGLRLISNHNIEYFPNAKKVHDVKSLHRLNKPRFVFGNPFYLVAEINSGRKFFVFKEKLNAIFAGIFDGEVYS